jgi:hypothetical protein
MGVGHHPLGMSRLEARREGVPVNRPVEPLDSLKELANYEDEVLDAVAATPHGALLFLSDPVRFLSEAGFVVGEGLRDDLNGLPGLKENFPGRYEDIRAGKGRAATWRVQIRSLGLKSGKFDKLDRRLPR